MTTKTIYTNKSISDFEVIRDYLPTSYELAFREERVQVTLALGKSSVDFFKLEAS